MIVTLPEGVPTGLSLLAYVITAYVLANVIVVLLVVGRHLRAKRRRQ